MLSRACSHVRKPGSSARCLLAASAAAALVPGWAGAQSPPAKPPAAAVHAVTDDYYGMKITDNYRYMEKRDDPEVAAWFKAQNDYTRTVLARLPGRAKLLTRIHELDEAVPAKVYMVRRLASGRLFYLKVRSGENMAKLYLRDAMAGQEKLLVDPEKMAAGGTPLAINYFEPSWDARYVAYGISPGGSENATIHIYDTTAGRELAETIDRAEFGVSGWLPDGTAFLYNRLQKLAPGAPPDAKYMNNRMYLHRLGTDPAQDPAVFGAGVATGIAVAPTDIPIVATQAGLDYAAGLVIHGVQREATLYVVPLAALGQPPGAGKPEAPWQKVCDVDDQVTDLAAHGDTLFLLTHKDAPRFKVLRTSLSHPDLAHAEVVVPMGPAVLTGLNSAADALYVQQLDGGMGRLLRVPFSGGAPALLKLPFDGSVSPYPPDLRVPGVLLDLTSWVRGIRIYAYDPASGTMIDTKLRPAGPFDNPEDLESEEVLAPSYDGTKVPLSIVHKKGLQLDGSHATVLNAYGAYGITSNPFFDPKLLAWLERDAVIAVCHVRGGGEYGQEWYMGGYKLTKPNTWRDMIACARYLVEKKYTSPAHLAPRGGSAGGITVGRTITEEPSLFGAAVIQVGALDTLRFEFSANGPPNVPEFGSVRTQEGFEDLFAMSSLAHVRDAVAYPAVLLTTGYNDPRVDSWEPGKMAARLQAATSSGKPVLLRVDYEAGHGIGSTKQQQQELMADWMSFLLWQFGAPDFQPAN